MMGIILYMRFCKDCFKCKSCDEFYNNPKLKSGKSANCIACDKIRSQKRRNKEREINKERTANWRKIPGNIEKQKEWNEKNIDRINENRRLNRLANNENHRKKQNDYYHANRERIIKKAIQRDKIKELESPVYKLKKTLRLRIISELTNSNYKKTKRTEEVIGAPIEIVKKHIERQFKKGMAWKNHGYRTWHIDHIIPLASAKTEEELLALFHYTNLQPLWAKENWSKNSKILAVQTKLTI